jgi:ArsR family transcriptional regulator
MDAELHARYEARTKVIKALAHPSRLLMVDELARGAPRCVCELTELVGADISTVSKHLAILKGAGLVSDEKRGNQVYYQLRVPCIVEFFRCIESVVKCSEQRGRRAIRMPRSCGACNL